MNLTYVIGIPGSGKTTLVARATEGLDAMPRTPKGQVAHILYLKDGDEAAAQLGVLRKDFAGTDGLSMSVQPKAVEWLRGGLHPEVLAEGDRLANLKFLHAAEELGYAVTLVLLDTPEYEAVARRYMRGSNQDATWLKGRTTKVNNLFEEWDGPSISIDGSIPLQVQVAKLRACPVFKVFR